MHLLFFCSGRGAVQGLLKVGRKQLYLYDASGVMHEMQPFCILDFYTHESCQRRGLGREIFDFMLAVWFHYFYCFTFFISRFLNFS